MRQALRAVALAAVGALLLTGCDFSVYEPAAARRYRHRATTRSGQGRVPRRARPGPAVDGQGQRRERRQGRPTSTLDGYAAEVTLELRRDVELPGNAVAEIRQTSLLGEKFVSLAPPETEAPAADSWTTATSSRSTRRPQPGGRGGAGCAQPAAQRRWRRPAEDDHQELNLALEGREDSVKSVLGQIEVLMSQLDENKADIVDAIEGLNRLSVSVSEQTGPSTRRSRSCRAPSIDRQAARRPGEDAAALDRARGRRGPRHPGVQGRRRSTRSSSWCRCSPSSPHSGDDFVNAFHVFLTYPFVDEVVGRDPQVARTLHMGDYTNLSITLDVDLSRRCRPHAGGTAPVRPAGHPAQPTRCRRRWTRRRLLDALACIASGDLNSPPCRSARRPAGASSQLQRGVQEAQEP